MADLRRCMIMSPLIAAQLMENTRGRVAGQVEPLKVFGGVHKNDYWLAEDNKLNPAFADLTEQLSMLEVVSIDAAYLRAPDEG